MVDVVDVKNPENLQNDDILNLALAPTFNPYSLHSHYFFSQLTLFIPSLKYFLQI